MNHFSRATLSVLALLALFSCRRGYSIDGNIDLYGYEEEELYLVTYERNEFTAIDSCCVRHGQFQMSGKIDSTLFALICHGFEPLMPLMLEKGKIQVCVSPSLMEAKGTRQNNDLYDFLDKKNDIDNRFEDMFQRSQSLKAIIDDEACYEDSLQTIVCEAEDVIYDFIRKHYSDEVGVAVFLMMCNGYAALEPTPLATRIVEDAPRKFLSNYKVRDYLRRVGME